MLNTFHMNQQVLTQLITPVKCVCVSVCPEVCTSHLIPCKQYAKFDVCGCEFAAGHANPLVSYPQHPKLLKLELPLKHTTAYPVVARTRCSCVRVLLSTALPTTPAFLQ